MKICVACGMPMGKPEDFAMGDTGKDYCVYCARPDGSMQSYPEKLEGMIDFIVRTQGLDPVAAGAAAKSMLSKLPAWKALGETK
ncbi:MAG TPA: zinc ribbon domain-containing protein [Rectinemataceae bacterium]|nr:zinc ribbon domain-containing protein [Rectinemataceae bacterium]